MADNIRIDSHKLIYHPDVVSRWLKGENIYPIEVEVSLSNACNHRCIFCAVDYTGYDSILMNKNILLKNLNEMYPKGLKSVIYAGEGEPLLHKDASEIINKTKEIGIDVALSTNGVLLTPEISRNCLKSLTWIRFSTAGILEDTYEKVQGAKKGDLQKVLNNMQEAVKVKKDQKLKTTIGVQLLLLPDNKDEIVQMGKELKKIGVDYFTIKPFSQHPKSQKIIKVDYSQLMGLEKEIKELETEEFKIYFRTHAMEELSYKKCYSKCLALPFMVHIDTKGDIWPCVAYVGREGFSYGNIYEKSFIEIWEGEQRKKVNEVFSKLDIEKNCREICRMNEMNKYLDELVHPGEHVNFI